MTSELFELEEFFFSDFTIHPKVGFQQIFIGSFRSWKAWNIFSRALCAARSSFSFGIHFNRVLFCNRLHIYLYPLITAELKKQKQWKNSLLARRMETKNIWEKMFSPPGDRELTSRVKLLQAQVANDCENPRKENERNNMNHHTKETFLATHSRKGEPRS